MKYLNKMGISTLMLSAILMLGISSCTIDDNDIDPTETSEEAYLYTGRYSTPDGRKFLMGAFPSVPSSNPDISNLTEITGTSVATFVHNGFVYSWDGEASEMTKWIVEDDLALTEDDVLSFANTGISGNNFGAAFISDTEAWLPGQRQGVMVKWNPSDMTITETVSISIPNTPNEAWNWRTYVSGNNLIIPLEVHDWDNLTTEDKAIVGMFNTQSKTMTYLEDDRVPANSMMFPDENGDLYLYPTGTTMYMEFYGPEMEYPAQGGMIRIKNGASDFDPDFYVNVMEETDGAASMGMFYVGNGKWLVKQYSDEANFPSPENLNDFWNKELDFKLFDHNTETSVDFPGKAKGYSGNNGWFVVDGENYHQNPNKVTGNTEVVIISESGWQKVFEIEGGDVNQLARIR